MSRGRDEEEAQGELVAPKSGDMMSELFLGSALKDRYKKMTSLFERQQEDPRRRRLRRPDLRDRE